MNKTNENLKCLNLCNICIHTRHSIRPYRVMLICSTQQFGNVSRKAAFLWWCVTNFLQEQTWLLLSGWAKGQWGSRPVWWSAISGMLNTFQCCSGRPVRLMHFSITCSSYFKDTWLHTLRKFAVRPCCDEAHLEGYCRMADRIWCSCISPSQVSCRRGPIPAQYHGSPLWCSQQPVWQSSAMVTSNKREIKPETP